MWRFEWDASFSGLIIICEFPNKPLVFLVTTMFIPLPIDSDPINRNKDPNSD